jgi:hypothetical protein
MRRGSFRMATARKASLVVRVSETYVDVCSEATRNVVQQETAKLVEEKMAVPEQIEIAAVP